MGAGGSIYHSIETSRTSFYVSVFMTAKILSSIAVKVEDTTVNVSLVFIRSDHFDIEFSKTSVNNAQAFKDTGQRTEAKAMIEV